ncbi:MAG: DNA-3-methyladenine glycosylase 2 family protein [Proteobacteria bacterium]|nr:DNA-3-methyladenine glycosylase 2 family protein [Pseudomonadota bacterium]
MPTPDWWPQALIHLNQDPVLSPLIARYPSMPIQTHSRPFTALARAIIGQQISTKAATSIWTKFTAVTPIHPQAVLNLPIDKIRSCGISSKKTDYLYDLAKHFTEELEQLEWSSHTDEDITLRLTRIHGIGHWSAQMFLIFHLSRADILPLDDLGLRRAMQQCCMKEIIKPTRTNLLERANIWRPYRTAATWYLWRSLDKG